MARFNVLAVVVGVLWLGVASWSQEEPRERQAAMQRVQSPIVNADRSVTVQLKAPKAQEATVEFYLEGESLTIPMEKSAEGLWTATTEPLEPGLHYYHINLDGVPVWDPGATWFKGYSKTQMCLVSIPGDEPPIYELRADIPHGQLTHERIYSETTKDLRGLNVYTPPSYRENPQKSYPVLYLLHGAGGDETRWVDVGLIDRVLDNWIASGAINELVVVVTSNRLGRDASLEDYFLKDIMPHVEKNYRVLTDNEYTAIAGFSMGGSQTFQLAFKHPERFGAACSLSGAIRSGASPMGRRGGAPAGGEGAPARGEASPEGPAAPRASFIDQYEILQDAAKTNEAYRQLYITCCDGDGLASAAKSLHEDFDKAGIRHVYLTGPGGHAYKDDWKFLVTYLADFTGAKQ